MAEQSIDKATPRPWRWEIPYRWLVGANKVTILHYEDFGNDEFLPANGDLMLEAVNSYDQLRTENAAANEIISALESLQSKPVSEQEELLGTATPAPEEKK